MHFQTMLSQGLRLFFKKATKDSAEEAVNSNFLLLMSEHLLKRIKPFRIDILSLGYRVCVCLKVNIKIMRVQSSKKKMVVDTFKIT